MPADFGKAQWTFSASSYAFITPTRIAATYTEGGRWKMALIETDPRKFEPLDLRLEPTEVVRADSRAVYFIGGSPADARAVVRVSLAAVEAEVLRPASTDRIDPAWVSVPEAIIYPSNGQDVHAFYYAPKNPDFTAPAGERPPLLVLSHGGPTGPVDRRAGAGHPVLDQPRLRRAGRELRRQQRLRTRVSRPPERPVGHRRRRRLRERRQASRQRRQSRRRLA